MSDEVRVRRRFAWDQVPDPLVTKLLLAVYLDSGEDPRAATPQRRQTLVAQTLGDPPSRAKLDDVPEDAAWKVLEFEWIHRYATPDQLYGLAVRLSRGLASPARYRGGRGKVALRNWFLDRNLTQTFKANLLTSFRSSYQKPQPLRGSSGQAGRGALHGPLVLAGEGKTPLAPYPHQREAWAHLDTMVRSRTPSMRSGLVVLPTGAGKTHTVVEWIVQRMSKQPQLRVLWLAHQEELLLQAAHTFEQAAARQPAGFRRRLRVISSGNSAPSTLREASLDIAVITWQSLHRSWSTHRRLVDSFLSRPTIVIVDEAHHAGASSYQEILVHLAAREPKLLIGLTATPWPRGTSATKMRTIFPSDVVNVGPGELHGSGILATPIIFTIDTHESITLSEKELKVARGDLPPSVMKHLQTEARDQLLLRTWGASPNSWGKTLIFATSTGHADALGGKFLSEGVPAGVIHSHMLGSRTDVLDWFRGHAGPCVLVSVGMLTEGVDLPDATTAFLARPTTSAILLRQMIGRVLRGPAAGGTATANVVYLRDAWSNFDDILDPNELPDLGGHKGHTGDHAPTRSLPPVFDEGGREIGEDVLAQVARMYARRTGRIPLDAATSVTRLSGYYDTGERHIPVMEHHREGYEELIDLWRRGKPHKGRPAMSFFDDVHPPYPTVRSLDAVKDYVRAAKEAPPFVSTVADIDPLEVASELVGLPALTVHERREWLHRVFEERLARVAYRSFEHFEEAVEQQIRELQRAGSGGSRRANPERTSRPPHPATRKLPRPLNQPKRQLPTVLAVMGTMEEVLKGEEALGWMPYGDAMPDLDWTRRPIKHAWAYWSLRTSRSNAGTPVIRVNRALQVSPARVPESALEYLVFHELLHDLLPGRGHDAEFRRLEAKWPDSDNLDLFLDTLHEIYDLG